MSVSAVLPPSVSKEVRALALPWLACLVCMLMPAVADAPRWLGALSVPAYFLGTAALGALSVGHEYSDRTLSLLLSLPVRRERLLALKLGVLAAMMLALWFVASSFVFSVARAPRAEREMAALLPVLCGLFLAPWLTMACRNPIGGTVFTVAVLGILLVIGELIGTATYGHGSVMEAFRLMFVTFGTLGVCAIGAVMGWWTFIRLEAIEGPGQDMRLPYWLRSASVVVTAAPHFTRRHPIWLLVKKELRLQQLALVLTALYMLEWFSIVWLASAANWTYADLSGALTILHAGLLPLLIGSSACAGERHMGTLEWQLLLPTSASKQFAVKVGVVWALALVLALALPAALAYFSRLIRAEHAAGFFRPDLATAVVIILLATGSLYISSLSRSGLWALLMSMPATLGATMFAGVVSDWGGSNFVSTPIPTALTLLLLTGFIAVVLRFALTNHRSADRPAVRVWTQILLIGYLAVAEVITLAAVQAFRR